MDAALYTTIWVALALFTLAEAGKGRVSQHRAVPAWAWPAWLSGAGLCTVHVALAFAGRHGWSHEAAVRETARQTAAVYGINWGGGVYVNYCFVAAWWIEAWWWRVYPSSYFGRRRAITWALRAFYFLIIVNAVIVFASVPRRALGVVLVGALLLVWIWRTGPRADSPALDRLRPENGNPSPGAPSAMLRQREAERALGGHGGGRRWS